jgi:hypothetical protein
MRLLLIGLVSMLSLTAPAACPDLSGVYNSCQSSSEDVYIEPFTLENNQENGVYIYTLTDQQGEKTKITTDGVIVTTTEIDGGVTWTQKVSASCKNNKLVLKGTVESGNFISRSKSEFSKLGPVIHMATTSEYAGKTEVSTATCIEEH